MAFADPARILVVRLGAMGDVIHALPAVVTLKHSFPRARLTWAVEPRWAALLRDNRFVDVVLAIDPRRRIVEAYRGLRASKSDLAVDFQGLVKSALVARVSGAERVAGFTWERLREKPAGLFYSTRARSAASHVVDQNLDLAAAVGAVQRVIRFPLPKGRDEGGLPEGEFVLANPAAGWRAKEWPASYYARLAGLLAERTGWPLVLNCAPGDRAASEAIATEARPGSCIAHVSSLEGLIFATRRARAVVAVDSGPLHLAAALGKPGVALFGPTDPARNGPYGESFVVLRAPGAATSYKRLNANAPSMLALQPEQVFEALEMQLARASVLEPHR
jgi:heptosyltransferase-1